MSERQRQTLDGILRDGPLNLAVDLTDKEKI